MTPAPRLIPRLRYRVQLSAIVLRYAMIASATSDPRIAKLALEGIEIAEQLQERAS